MGKPGPQILGVAGNEEEPGSIDRRIVVGSV